MTLEQIADRADEMEALPLVERNRRIALAVGERRCLDGRRRFFSKRYMHEDDGA